MDPPARRGKREIPGPDGRALARLAGCGTTQPVTGNPGMAIETVFVYGSLKRGFVNHHVIADAKFLGTGVTGPGFAMLDLGR